MALRLEKRHKPNIDFSCLPQLKAIIEEITSEKISNHKAIIGDDILNHDYITAFSNLRKKINGKIELCPENRYCSATAIAVEWILYGEQDIAVSFTGIGSKACLEEVMMALRLEKRHKPNIDFSCLPQLKLLIEEITNEKISNHKAIIGDDIFNIESGIHANGISKNPELYEPFKPELVGIKRQIIIGKHSGSTALTLKMSELGIPDKNINKNHFLKCIQNKSIEIGSSITDEMFLEIYNSIAKGCAIVES